MLPVSQPSGAESPKFPPGAPQQARGHSAIMTALLPQGQLGSPWASVSSSARRGGGGSTKEPGSSSSGMEGLVKSGLEVLMILLRLSPAQACGIRARFWQAGRQLQKPSSLRPPLLGSCQRVESIKRKERKHACPLQDGGDQRAGTSVLEGRTCEPRQNVLIKNPSSLEEKLQQT